jgi:hypothetical protein
MSLNIHGSYTELTILGLQRMSTTSQRIFTKSTTEVIQAGIDGHSCYHNNLHPIVDTHDQNYPLPPFAFQGKDHSTSIAVHSFERITGARGQEVDEASFDRHVIHYTYVRHRHRDVSA